jgi:hypothetical protein
VFPSLVLAQIVSAVDNGALFRSNASAAEKHEVVYDSLKTSFGLKHNTPDQDFWILHALRMGEKHERKFLVWEIYYDSKRKGWRNTALPIPASTGLVKVLGSGAACAQKHIDRWSWREEQRDLFWIL